MKDLADDRKPMARKTSSTSDSTANLGFEAKLWIIAYKLRNNMDAAEYKHVILCLNFPNLYYPACGSSPAVAGFVQSAKNVQSQSGKLTITSDTAK